MPIVLPLRLLLRFVRSGDRDTLCCCLLVCCFVEIIFKGDAVVVVVGAYSPELSLIRITDGMLFRRSKMKYPSNDSFVTSDQSILCSWMMAFE